MHFARGIHEDSYKIIMNMFILQLRKYKLKTMYFDIRFWVLRHLTFCERQVRMLYERRNMGYVTVLG